jgi:glyoxylase-like metal-dependent hydrolase (beta-lactamase superfamily II)
MIFEELNGVDSECRSYLVGDSGEALIVDPLLERVHSYVARLSPLGLRLAYAADTHTHADHLSGSKELSRRTGAKTAGAPRSAVLVPLAEGSVLIVGQIAVRVWASPGHTRTRSCSSCRIAFWPATPSSSARRAAPICRPVTPSRSGTPCSAC